MKGALFDLALASRAKQQLPIRAGVSHKISAST
jgi:hypothetical protein